MLPKNTVSIFVTVFKYSFNRKEVSHHELINFLLLTHLLDFPASFDRRRNVKNTGKHSKFSIGTGAEVIGNMLIAFKSYYENIEIIPWTPE